MNQLKKLVFFSALTLFSQAVYSQTDISETATPEAATPEIAMSDIKVESNSFFKSDNHTDILTTNINALRTLLLSHNESIVMALPLPSGEFVNFKLTPSSIMAYGLAKKYSNIKTFSGVAIDNPNYTGRFDITPNGFHGMFSYRGERVFIEPKAVYIQTKGKLSTHKRRKIFNTLNEEYKSYFSQKENQNSETSNTLSYNFHPPKKITQKLSPLAYAAFEKTNKVAKNSALTSAMKTYRIALSAAAEYTEFNGGTVDSAMAEIITLVNRLNQVYQRDLAIKLELVENNNLLVFTDANKDPFDNNDGDGEINTGVIDGIIGSANYDIGHVVNTNGGGLAVLGAVCSLWLKGDGVTGSSNPTNDAFYIDYVAHEIGHQFGADHTFNGTAGACSGNRAADSAYEVGSGSTIMSYAGICNEQDLQFHSDAFFHTRSIDQINEYTQNATGSTCGSVTGETNNVAVVDAGLDFTIPAHTPFKLVGSAEDIDSVNLSYSWQQFDLGTESSSLAEQIDDGSRPLFRAFLPSSNTERYFPQLSDVLNATTSVGESLPTTNRDLNFRLMVLDNEGGVSFDEVKLTVVDTAQAFALTSPSLNDTWTASNNQISWNVAQTNEMPINCSTVDILLSKDNGESFNVSLASGLDNNGGSNISIDSFCANEINTEQGRIKLVCVNNIFFAINDGVFSINKAISVADIAIINQQILSLTQGESIELATSQFTYKCETPDAITIQSGDNYTFTDTTITPNSDFLGVLSVAIIVNKDDINSEIFYVSINVEAKPEPTPEQPVTKSSGSMTWLLLFIFILPWRVWILDKTLVKRKQSYYRRNY